MIKCSVFPSFEIKSVRELFERTMYNLFIDLDKNLVADLSDNSAIYKYNLTLKDLSKILLANPKIFSSCLQDVSLGRCYTNPSMDNVDYP